MSVRRLAERALQPASFAFTGANAAWAKQTIRKYPKGRQQSAVIPLLMRAQEQEGWVTQAAIEHVAEMLDMPLIRVLEVATFYTQYQLSPVGTKAHIQVCGTTPCMLRGAGDLIEACKKRINPEPFETNEAGTLSWEEVECLGACVNAPMVMIFKDTYEDLTPERLEEIIDAFEAGKGKSIEPGPQVDRIYSAPEGGLTSLTDEKIVTKGGRKNGAAKLAAGKAKPQSGGAPVPPSKSAKPKTAAVETSPAVKSPSKAKASVNGEQRASAASPSYSKKAADKAEPNVEKTGKQRSHPRPDAAAEKGGKVAENGPGRPGAAKKPK
jgi:NADH-quinone oxidoreductase subunit E